MEERPLLGSMRRATLAGYVVSVTPRVARSVVVRGRVQGVGFRRFVASAATARGLSGWVRNRRDGSVEALGEGELHAVEAWLEDLRHGAFAPHVDSFDVRGCRPFGSVAGFRVAPTE